MIIIQGYANGVNVVLVLLYYANNLCEEDITILLKVRELHFLYLDNN